MSCIRRFCLIAFLLGVSLAVTPPRIYGTSLALAGLCLFCVLVVQLGSMRNRLGAALSLVAIWALLSVMAGPFVPLMTGLGEVLRAVAR